MINAANFTMLLWQGFSWIEVRAEMCMARHLCIVDTVGRYTPPVIVIRSVQYLPFNVLFSMTNLLAGKMCHVVLRSITDASCKRNENT